MPRREQPLEPGDDPLLRFAAGLRQLREQAGKPTYRQLSARAHYSAAALSEAAGGRKLPSLAVTLVPGYPMAFSSDRHLVASIHPAGTTRLWDVTDPKRPLETGTVATDIRTDVIPDPGAELAFSPDGRWLVSVGGDKTARLWNISDPRHPREEATLRGHAGEVLAVAFHPDGHTIATAGNDHLVRLWEADAELLAARVCEIAYPRITKAEWGSISGAWSTGRRVLGDLPDVGAGGGLGFRGTPAKGDRCPTCRVRRRRRGRRMGRPHRTRCGSRLWRGRRRVGG